MLDNLFSKLKPCLLSRCGPPFLIISSYYLGFVFILISFPNSEISLPLSEDSLLKKLNIFKLFDQDMKRNCNLELRLLPLFPDADHYRHNPSSNHYSQPMMNDVNGSLQQQEQQQLTLFYDGDICVSDVTEFQARAILRHASREMDMARGERTPTPRSEPSSPTLTVMEYSQYPKQLFSPSSRLSMKRSLQRFLQKRKNRIQDGSPY